MNLKKLISELKRRNVFKVAAVYAVTGWLVIQVVTSVFPAFKFPDWTTQFVIILVLIGFPIAVIIAWAFEMTPEGVKRTDEVLKEQSITKTTGKKLSNIFIVVLTLAVIVLSYKLFFAKQPITEKTASSKTVTSDSLGIPSKSIAVLPFENLSSDSNNAYFADGMQDMILTKLDQVGGLKVISRTSTEQYKSHPGNLTSIANELRVATVLEGSVQKSGNQVLVNVQLIDARTDQHLWANDYTRTLNNVFGVEGEVAGNIAHALKVKLAPSEKNTLQEAPTDNGQAFNLYLKAKYQVDRYTNTNALPNSAIKWYHQAIRLDPTFAMAYANLANVERFWSFFKTNQKDSLRNQALLHARKALAIDPNLPEGHLYLGEIYQVIDQNYDRAEPEWKEAYKLSPNNTDILSLLSIVDMNSGKMDAAMQKRRLAVELDPKNSKRITELADLESSLRNYKTALQLYDRASEINPDDYTIQLARANLLLNLGLFKQARATLKSLEEIPSLPTLLHMKIFLSYIAGNILDRNFKQMLVNTHEAYTLSKGFFKQIRTNYPSGLEGQVKFFSGVAYYFMGQKDSARTYFRQAQKELSKPAVEKVFLSESSRLNTVAYCEAFLGERDSAIQSIKKAIRLVPVTNYYIGHDNLLESLAEIYALTGDAAHAVPLLQQLFGTKGTGTFMTPFMIRHSPMFDRIRKDPGFQALVKKYPEKKE